MDTLTMTNALVESGMPEKQAQAQVKVLQEATKDFATKADIAALRQDMVTKADFHKEMTVLAWRVITALLGMTAIFGGIVAVVAKLFLG